MFIETVTSLQVDEDYTVLIGRNELGRPAVELLYQNEEVGFSYAECRFTREWFVHSLWIDETHRGKGLGQWLLLALSEAVRIKMQSKRAYLTPCDWTRRRYSWYKKGEMGTSLAALRVWDKLGGGPI